MTSRPTNWAGNIAFNAERVSSPSSVEELRALVAGSRRVRALGSGHSFNAIADTPGDLVSVARLPRTVEIDRDAGAVTVSAGLRYGEFAAELHDAGFALRNLGSLPHITVSGACATGTHGSGVGNGGLATAVRALELVGADGELVSIQRGDEGFDGWVVALGALGVVTRMTLDLVAAYDVQQWVYEDLAHEALYEGFEQVMSAAYSVSLFTDWRSDQVGQVWLKHRVDADGPVAPPLPWPGAKLAAGPRHPIPGMSPEPCTPQLGVAGPWYQRLPHFRLEFTPSSGDELQSEYFVEGRDAVDAFQALNRIRDRIAPVLQISEIRTVAADDLWLSPCQGRDSVVFHFTWVSDADAVASAVAAVEEALAPYDARPHWGKVFRTAPATVRRLYKYHDDFRGLIARADPTGKFRNDFIENWFDR